MEQQFPVVRNKGHPKTLRTSYMEAPPKADKFHLIPLSLERIIIHRRHQCNICRQRLANLRVKVENCQPTPSL